MLVLTRKASQAIRLGDNITITVIRTSNGAVKLGIQAPPEVRVVRDELEPSDRAENASRTLRTPQDWVQSRRTDWETSRSRTCQPSS